MPSSLAAGSLDVGASCAGWGCAETVTGGDEMVFAECPFSGNAVAVGGGTIGAEVSVGGAGIVDGAGVLVAVVCGPFEARDDHRSTSSRAASFESSENRKRRRMTAFPEVRPAF